MWCDGAFSQYVFGRKPDDDHPVGRGVQRAANARCPGGTPYAIAFVLGILLPSCSTPDDMPTALNLIPTPVSATIDGGYLLLGDDARVAASPQAESVAATLGESMGLPVEVRAGAKGDVVLSLDSTATSLGEEGYELTVTDRVTIRALTPAGLFYGGQTLRQLLPPDSAAAREVPRVTIHDTPRFAWRGAMLDVARHFFGVADVKRYIDLCAYHKLNRLHLHLTDDQGWRIHIDSWPRLTEVGGATEVGGGPGGFFTKADYADIVAYAEKRFMVVVPEIDMPGHSNAALSSYGSLNPDGQPSAPYTGTDVGFSSLWLSDDITMMFVTDVISEVAAMTPGPWIHIGGDEAMATLDAEYNTFIAAVQGVVGDAGKTLVGWEEIASADLTEPFLAQYWLRKRDALAAAAGGAKIISSPAPHAYLDIKYDTATPIGLVWVGFTDVDKAYQWDPVMEGLTEDDVIGVEAPLWTETVTDMDELELMAFPRLPGHAEIAWSPAAGRDWLEYRVRLAHHGLRLDALGVNYYRSIEVDWLVP